MSHVSATLPPKTNDRSTRRLSVGAEVQAAGATHFRVWAPDPRDITLVVEPRHGSAFSVSLTADSGGYRSALVADVASGDRYWYRVDGDLLPDPASRFQPEGPSGPSEVVDPSRFAWTDKEWRGVTLPSQVLYELHVGTFTSEGTWRSAMERLQALVETGITVVEVMPVSEFPGRFGWGYDGVFPYAPTRLYGKPDDLRTFIDCAHGLGVAVILDVVYNHLGPDGCVLGRYAKAYYSARYQTEWGDALNFDGPGSAQVREYFGSNARYWIDEYHFDGLRFDATQSTHDATPEHVIASAARQARAAAHNRSILLIAENEPQDVRFILPPEHGGYGLDVLWNDDFHHAAVVALTGRREAYYSDYSGSPQEFISATKYGYLFQGQRYDWQRKRRGTRTTGVPPHAFVHFIENHDQVANAGAGARLHTRTTPGRYRAMTTLLLLAPQTPMLFQGQEFGSSSPFMYFADHRRDLAEAVQNGRASFMAQFPSLASPEIQSRLPAPHDPDTFNRCKVDWTERERNVAYLRLHQDLLTLRRTHEAFRQQLGGGVDGAVLAPEVFVLRFMTREAADERLLVVNLGPDLIARSFAEPLMAPPSGFGWLRRWSSEDPSYGGLGTPDVTRGDEWRIPGHSAIVFQPA